MRTTWAILPLLAACSSALNIRAANTTITTASTSVAVTSSSATASTSTTAPTSLTSSATSSAASSTPSTTYPDVTGKTLRILPLGDSITHGYGSTTYNGYRWVLWNLLSQNNNITFIGSVQAGNLSTPFSEGHDGATIANISHFANEGLGRRPTVVLLQAGTNDCFLNYSLSTAPQRLAALIDQVYASNPDITLLVAEITPADDTAMNNRIIAFNAAVPGVVQQYAAAGKRIIMVDQYTGINVNTDLMDGLHPDDAGYAHEARVWYEGLKQAAAKGWLDTIPASVADLAPRFRRESCTAYPTWQWTQWIASGPGWGPSKHAGVNCTDAASGSCFCTYYDGTNRTLPVQGSCALMSTSYFNNLQFADLNGDGISDYIWISPDGSVTAWYFNNPGWTLAGAPLACCTGARPEEIQFADLDGDGRADYIWIRPDGSVAAYLNNPTYGWVSLGDIWPATAWAPGAGVRFQDVDGDGKADWTYVDPVNAGVVTAFKNNYVNGQGFNWTSWGVVMGFVGATRDNNFFVDVNGDGYPDYIVIDRNTGAINVWWSWMGTNWAYGQLVFWPGGQIAPGFGAGLDGSQVFLADMSGDGRVEYLFVNSDYGAVYQFLNWC